jgi:hypothetical protein
LGSPAFRLNPALSLIMDMVPVRRDKPARCCN